MKAKKPKLLGCAGLCLAMATLVPAYAADPVITNSSFEDGLSTGYIAGDSTDVTGWTTKLNGVERFDPSSYGWGSAHDGSYAIDLAPYIYTGGGIAITGGITTVPGSDYTLKFYATTLQASGRDGTGQVDVYINGNLTQTFNLINDTGTVSWQLETVNFTAANATTYIKFQNEQDPTLHFAMIDDVSVTYVPPDADGDGVPDDGTDLCLGTPAGTPVDATGCPLPPDEDGDGVPDASDSCLGTPSGTAIDATGCNALPLADLTMSKVSFGIMNIKRNAGTNVSVTDTVENLVEFSTTRRFNVAYHLSPDAAYGGGNDVNTGTTRSINSLDGLSSNTWPITSVQIPSDTPPGDYYLCAKADVPNVVVESDDTNNKLCAAKKITVPDPDLVMNQVSTFVTSVTAGDTMPVLDSLSNNGGSQALAFEVGYVLSKNRILGDADDTPLTETRSIGVLGVGATSTGTVDVTIPPGTAAGTYWVFGIADVNGDVTELKETNNAKRASSSIKVIAP